MASAPPDRWCSSSQEGSSSFAISSGGGPAGRTITSSPVRCHCRSPSQMIVSARCRNERAASSAGRGSIRYRPDPSKLSRETMCMVATRSPAASMRWPSPPKPARRAPSGTWASIAAMSCHWCSVAAIPGAQRSRLARSRCSTSSVAAGASAGSGSASGGISVPGSSCVACSKGRDREDLTSAPIPPAARPAISLLASQPGPRGAVAARRRGPNPSRPAAGTARRRQAKDRCGSRSARSR